MKNLPTLIDLIKDVVDSLVGGVLVEVQHTYVYITGDREADIAVLLYIYIKEVRSVAPVNDKTTRISYSDRSLFLLTLSAHAHARGLQ